MDAIGPGPYPHALGASCLPFCYSTHHITVQDGPYSSPPVVLLFESSTFAFPYPVMCLGSGRDPDSLKFWPFTYKILASKVCRPQLGLQKEILIGLGKWTLLFYASKLLSLDSTQTSFANFCHLHRSDILANHYICWSHFPRFPPPPFKAMPIMEESSKSSEWHRVRIIKS